LTGLARLLHLARATLDNVARSKDKTMDPDSRSRISILPAALHS
jgi:hypothetical protein